MNTFEEDQKAYLHLCDSVSASETLQLMHYGITLKDKKLDETKDRGTTSPFVKSKDPVVHYYSYDNIIAGRQCTIPGLSDVKGAHLIGMNYAVNNRSHGITGFTISHVLPKIIAAPGYKVKWCENVASNIVQYGEFKHKDELIHSFDAISSDMINSVSQITDFSESIYRDLGNIPELQRFSEELPQYSTVYNPPFFFCGPDPSNMFPLYMCGFGDTITINLVLRTRCRDLLIVARENMETGELTLVNQNANEKYATFMIDGKEVDCFENPVCVANYVYLTQDECNENWCSTEQLNKERTNVSFCVNQPFSFKSTNPSTSGNVTVDNITVPYVCNQIYWAAHSNNIKTNVLSNYTTSPYSCFKNSISPIVNTTISNGSVELLQNAPQIVTTRIHPRFASRQCNNIPGIHSKSFGIRSTNSSTKPGFFFKSGRLSCLIDERCPEVLNRDREACNRSYIIQVRLMCQVNYTFTHFCKSEEERRTNGTTIITKIN